MDEDTFEAEPHHHGPLGALNHALMVVSMVFGRGPVARGVADLAQLNAEDRVVDVGCGPGAAVRVAALQCAEAIGVDPSPSMVHLGRRISWLRRRRNTTFRVGSAESIPLSGQCATVFWALSSVHHWNDRNAGIVEVVRILLPGGRVLLVERVNQPGTRGHATYGLTWSQLDSLAGELEAVGFTAVKVESRTFGRRAVAVVSGVRPESG